MKIRIFSPSSSSSSREAEEGLSILHGELESLCPDLEIIVDENLACIPGPNPDLYYIAGSDAEKAASFQDLINDPELDFVLCCRGGYGALRWLHLVDWRSLDSAGPLLVGFSDVTSVFSALLNLGGKAVHGPMLNTLALSSIESRLALWKFMASGQLPVLAGKAHRGDSCFRGVLTGGNLACICHLIGTPYEPKWQDRILFLEDCNEPAYRLDRMFTHLRLAGVFDQIGGLALGQFTGLEGRDSSLLEKVLADRVSGFDFPVVWNLPCGHGSLNMPLLLGRHYEIRPEEGVLAPA